MLPATDADSLECTMKQSKTRYFPRCHAVDCLSVVEQTVSCRQFQSSNSGRQVHNAVK